MECLPLCRYYFVHFSVKHFIFIESIKWGHCGLVGSAPAWDRTGCEFDSWQCRIYTYPMFIEPTITWVSSGFSGYIWLDTKIVLKKIYIYTDKVFLGEIYWNY